MTGSRGASFAAAYCTNGNCLGGETTQASSVPKTAEAITLREPDKHSEARTDVTSVDNK